MIHAEVTGRAHGRTVVLVHGFTQTGRNWSVVATELAHRYRVVTLDAPGHGGSRDAPAALWKGADVLAEAGGRGTWVGYSMGGRYALHVALAHPDVVDRLVLVGATAGIDDPVERSARREQDDALAGRLEAIGLDAFLDEWLANPLFATLTPSASDRAARAENTVSGLAASLREAGTGRQESLWSRLRQLTMPVLVVAGQSDTKFSALGERLVTTIGPHARLAIVPGSGHAVHLEQPVAFLRLLENFLSDPERPERPPSTGGTRATR